MRIENQPIHAERGQLISASRPAARIHAGGDPHGDGQLNEGRCIPRPSPIHYKIISCSRIQRIRLHNVRSTRLQNLRIVNCWPPRLINFSFMCLHTNNFTCLFGCVPTWAFARNYIAKRLCAHESFNYY